MDMVESDPVSADGLESSAMKLRIGSRGSQLALWQAHHIAGLLRAQGHEVEIEIIKTTGDRLQEVTFAQAGAMTGTKGLFTKEIEEALAAGRVDLAVHSLEGSADGAAGAVCAGCCSAESRRAGCVCFSEVRRAGGVADGGAGWDEQSAAAGAVEGAATGC